MEKELSEGKRGQIMALSNEGMSQRKIAEKLHVSKGAVQRMFERFRESGSYSTKRRSARPRANATKEDRYIKVTSLRNRTPTAGNI